MYQYKRGINPLEQAKLLEFSLSNHHDTCLCMSGVWEAKKPYHGMYIKDGRVILENVMEEIEVKDKVYRMGQLSTSVQNICCDEYIASIDLAQNKICYQADLISYTKQIQFADTLDLLFIHYEVENKCSRKMKFRMLPMITYRDLFHMRTAPLLRLNQRSVEQGTMINLSIIREENIVFKCKEAQYTKEPRFIHHVKHDFMYEDKRKEIFTEDLFIPGDFEVTVGAGEKKSFMLVVSTKDVTLNAGEIQAMLREKKFRQDKIYNKIEKEFVELMDLSTGMDQLTMEGYAVATLPYLLKYQDNWDEEWFHHEEWVAETIQNMIAIVKAIDGQYLTFDKNKEADQILQMISSYITRLDQEELTETLFLNLARLKLWWIEMANKLFQKQENVAIGYVDTIKTYLYQLLSPVNQKRILNTIEMCALSYNDIKIYENMLSKLGGEDGILYDISLCIQNLIQDQFWCEEKRCMRRTLQEEEIEPNIEMMYTLSLSYPCMMGNTPIKLLDTIFKELYTPYGLRVAPKNSVHHQGLIYPQYMAHFVKANLRQNGVTRASQKIAYNLVKELIQDISKYVNGGIKKVYHEKGYPIDTCSYDLLTNAEMIRLYDMLT